MNGTHKFARPGERNSTGALHAASPIVRSAIGIVRESAGLVSNVVQFGVALFSELKKVEPSQPTILGPNIFMFPTNQRSNPKK